MKKVLMVIFYFPPLGGSGVFRPLKFIKYLTDFGWEPIVLTVDDKRPPGNDDSSKLLNELPKKLKIYRSKYLGFKDISRLIKFNNEVKKKNQSVSEKNYNSFSQKLINIINPVIIPDQKVGWYPFAIRRAKQIFRENNIDVIYSTSPYPTAHLIAMSLSNKYDKPWVADFRDPWTKFFYVKRNFPFKQIEMSMEKRVLKKADRIITAWPGIQDNFKFQYRNKFSSKTILLNNGFDEQDFNDVTSKTFSKFTIVYIGIFYKERTPEALYRAIKSLLHDKPSFRKDIQIIQIGTDEQYITNLIEDYKLNDVVHNVPYLPHKECLSYLLGADILYLNTVQNHVPGKMFEYIRSKKPILSLTSYDKTVSEIVNSTRSGIVIDPSETEKIKETIIEMFEKHKKGELKLEREDDSIIYQYERKNLTGKLADIFNDVI